MSKFKLACHLIQFAGEQNENPEKVFREVAEAGWDGVEGIGISSSDDLIDMATLASRFGLHLVNVGGMGLPSMQLSTILLLVMMLQRFQDSGEAIGGEITQLRPILNRRPKL
jgi:hypothetical protein